ncbi:Aim11p KNAG_0C03610 [Huiozyma naganishii CBS 8797]|uniref:Altered inheritance of mitochondria protein 11 n=1 Tax=Huiozyma naganishii (strain ATCC MYA-139 / BCRC 22969 / CBS 8797 / KCTC 17520 / NBRC 10181 / NCYC 3082 / Yp74L-3) TaxID=1071383 RepID=J7R3S7_HUIN7|nr:hypothetical protein KNAG_0C03610 [Kazachstania naganishii CBS 8797]CCK69465.1 hypothetical protein KNAG_0C03610 [Kazachstania naganishii CBS 8797]
MPLNEPPADDRKFRRGKEMSRFFVSTALTLFFSKLTHRTISMMKYRPTTFQANHVIPPMNSSTKLIAPQAVALSTGLSAGFFSMVVFGTCWIFDINSVQEFTLGFKRVLSPLSERIANKVPPMEDDEATSELENELKDLFKTDK